MSIGPDTPSRTSVRSACGEATDGFRLRFAIAPQERSHAGPAAGLRSPATNREGGTAPTGTPTRRRGARAARALPRMSALQAEQALDAKAHELDHVTELRRRKHGRDDGTEAGEREDDERPDTDAPADETRDALRVDEDLPHLQARDERRRHPGAVALEKLDQVQVRADGDDQLGALFVGEQERDVLADSGRRDGVMRQPELLEPRGARRAAVAAVGVDDDLGAAAQRLVRH